MDGRYISGGSNPNSVKIVLAIFPRE